MGRDREPGCHLDCGTLSDDEPILYRIFCELFATHLGWRDDAGGLPAGSAGSQRPREIIEKAIVTPWFRPTSSTCCSCVKQRYREMVVVEDNPIRDATIAGLGGCWPTNHVPMAIVTGAQRDDVMAVLANSPVGDHRTSWSPRRTCAGANPIPRLPRRRRPDEPPPGRHAGVGDLISACWARGRASAYRCIAVGARPGAELRNARGGRMVVCRPGQPCVPRPRGRSGTIDR